MGFRFGESKNKNPLNDDENNSHKYQAKRVEPQLESDKFSPQEQKEIVTMVIADAEQGLDSLREWRTKKRKDLQHINGEAPSKIEDLNKKAWMSDRNLGLAAGTSDIYQATLLATCYNPDMIHYKATESNDIDNKDNLELFTKWGLSEAEANFFPEVDDFINNKVNLGFSMFRIEWEVTYEWVDKRIPIYDKDNKSRLIRYEIETERRRFERGVIVNIDEVDDILIPNYGKHVQKLKFLIEVLHITINELEDYSDRGIIVNFEDNKNKFAGASNVSSYAESLRREDEDALGQRPDGYSDGDSEKRNCPIDVYQWHGYYKKNGRRERYRFWVERESHIFLGGKPLRKINRTGEYPYVGGPLRRRPGFLRGGSLISLIAPAINGINNIFNQLTDFQYFQNCPGGYYDKNNAEGLSSILEDISPGKMSPVDGDPNNTIMFPNMQRSTSWGYQYLEFLLQVVERLTGAASYFLTSDAKNATATRDSIVEQKGEVKFGLWVKRTQQEISEAINMWIKMYQDWAPPSIAKRVLGNDDKVLIRNLSIDSLRGNYDAYMIPDITSGSKAYERQISMWATQVMQQGNVWMSPQMNPRGNWLMWEKAMKDQGIQNADHYMPPQPKANGEYDKQAEDHFTQLMQGEMPEPPDANNPQIVDCLRTFVRFSETRVHELDEEYRPNFEAYLFKAQLNYNKFMQTVQQQQMVNQIAMQAVQNLETSGQQAGQPGQQGAPQGGMPPQGAPRQGLGQPIPPNGMPNMGGNIDPL